MLIPSTVYCKWISIGRHSRTKLSVSLDQTANLSLLTQLFLVPPLANSLPCLTPSLHSVPRDVSDTIYGRVQGAIYDAKNEYWTMPCGQYLNISFGFGGRQYPIHPLDTG